ncbi:MAG: dihydrolipoamide acetyltransferase family protein [bacterium]|nr:dihydrolipoamide acetyltransferase family protein [bacterium]MDE0290689.1 dihydrolipoamide acetyltransferase family protein [bacterium]MDE0437242.1 dihydrolipoamide acetyltransferase family protein [bacterium]
MAYVFELPDIGEGLTEADIIRWHVPVGDRVTMDQILVEVETAKAVVEIPSPAAGTLLHHGAGEGTTLTVGAVLAVIGESGESWRGQDANSDGPATGQGVPNSDTGKQQARYRSAGGSRRGKALPVVRKLAREHGVDLGSITGSGPGGRITRDDVMAAATRAEPRPEATGDERVRLSMLRRTIAEHMSSSWREIPHVTIFQDVDATRLLTARRALAGRYERQIPMEALVVKALAPVLDRFREFNATLDGDELILHRSLDVGIAVDTADGLLVPIIPNAGEMGLLSLAEAVSDLGTRGKARTLAAHELSGATFTVSNFGALGGGRGTPIIPLGTTAILAVGRAEDTPVVRNGSVSIAPMMPLSLAFDHRVIDGGAGQRFVAMLVENLEEPALFLAD